MPRVATASMPITRRVWHVHDVSQHGASEIIEAERVAAGHRRASRGSVRGDQDHPDRRPGLRSADVPPLHDHLRIAASDFDALDDLAEK